jgi:hypothetical protein
MQPHSGQLRKGQDAVQEKAATQEKDVAEDGTDPDLTQATETKVQSPTVNPNQKGKGKAETKKENRDPDLVPLVTESRKIHAAIAAVIITLPEPATSVRMTKRTVRQNHHTSKQTSTLPSTRRP